MSVQYAHHRPLTPITPVHSPHPSNGSIPRTRTPGQLSLHEYRKSQVTPSPPAVHGQKSVKKKRAASSLKNYEGTPAKPASPELFPSYRSLSTPPLTPLLPVPSNFTSHLSLPNAPPTRDDPVFAEFSHLTFTPTTCQPYPSLDHTPLLTKPLSSSSSHFLLPSNLQASPPTNFFSNPFPFTHATAKPSQSSYQAIGGGDLEEEQPSIERYLTFEQMKHSISMLPSPSIEAHEQQAFSSQLHKSSKWRDILTKLNNSSDFTEREQVSSCARVLETERGFEKEETFDLAQNSGHAQLQAQRSNSSGHQTHIEAHFQGRLIQFSEQQVHTNTTPRERHFKSIKRLPHPDELSRRRPSPLTFESSARPASVRHTSLSTLSLSQFPQPPQGKAFSFRPERDPALRTSAPPTTLHHRGASFDLLNPHDSLRLSDIRTPLEIEDSDYFSAPLPLLLQPEKMSDNIPKGEQVKRAVFKDFRDAFETIRKTSGPFQPSQSEHNTPGISKIEERPKYVDHRGRWIPDEVDTEAFRVEDAPREERSEIVKKYQSDQASDEEPPGSPFLMQKVVSRVSSIAGSIRRKSLGLNFDGASDEYDDEYNEPAQSELSGITPDYEESDYALSNYAQSIADNRRSAPFGYQVGETNYSEFAPVDCYRFRNLTQASNVQDPSTVSRIIDGYGQHHELSEAQAIEPEDASDEESYDSRPLLAHSDSEDYLSRVQITCCEQASSREEGSSHIESDRDLKHEITGLGDLIACRLSPGRDSDEDIGIIARPLLHATPSAPPSFLLPELPTDVQRSVPLFAVRFASNRSSDVVSHGQSYGDTKQLLELNPNDNLVDTRYPNNWPLRRSALNKETLSQGASEEHGQLPEHGEANLAETDQLEARRGIDETYGTPPKLLRVTNPDPSSDPIIPDRPEEPDPVQDKSSSSDSDLDDSFDQPPKLDKGKQRALDTHSYALELLRQDETDPAIELLATFDSVSTITQSHTHPGIGIPPTWILDRAEGPIALSRQQSLEDIAYDDGSIADMSDEAIVEAMNESDGDDWATINENSEFNLARDTSMAEYDSAAPPMPTWRGRIVQDQGHGFPVERYPESRYYAGVKTGPERQSDSSSTSLPPRPYVDIPDDQLSPEPDDSPAEVTCSPLSYVYIARAQYAQDAKYVEPAPPEPAYYSPTRRPGSRTQHDSIDDDKFRKLQHEKYRKLKQESIELLDLRDRRVCEQRQKSPSQSPDIEMGRCQREYRQSNGSGFARASVRSQRVLQPLAMTSNRSVASDHTHMSTYIKHGKHYSAANWPGLPKYTNAEDVGLSELQKLRFPDHHLAKKIKQRVVAGRVCCVIYVLSIPAAGIPLLGMGFGSFDFFIKYITHGKVPYVPDFWKHLSRRTAPFAFAIWILAITGILAYHAGLNAAHK